MTPEALKQLDKDVRKARRIAGEWAMQLHDLVEDGLPGEYARLPAMAQSTWEACKTWDDARQKLAAAEVFNKQIQEASD